MKDTTPEARAAQLETYRRMTGEQRLTVALDLSETVRELARTRIRRQNPDFEEWEVEDELVQELYGYRRAR